MHHRNVNVRARRSPRHAAAFAAGVVLLALAPAVFAAEPSAADKETARGLVARGQTLYESRDFAGALKAFQAAHAIMGLPTTGVPLGKAQIELGLLVEARDTLYGVTRHPKKTDEPEPFGRARAEATELAEKIGARIATLEISFVGAPSGADVRLVIDGVSVPAGAETAPRRVNPGAHKLEARAEGFNPAVIDVLLEAGETKQLPIPLTKTGDADAPNTGAVTGPKPLATTADAAPSTKTSPLVYIGFGAAGVGVVAGSITGLMAMSSASAAKENCEGMRCRPEAQGDIDSAKTLGLVSTIGFGVALVGAGVGIYGLLSPTRLSPSPEGQVGVRITPVVGPGSFHLVGRF